jgi:hypothetical protein
MSRGRCTASVFSALRVQYFICCSLFEHVMLRLSSDIIALPRFMEYIFNNNAEIHWKNSFILWKHDGYRKNASKVTIFILGARFMMWFCACYFLVANLNYLPNLFFWMPFFIIGLFLELHIMIPLCILIVIIGLYCIYVTSSCRSSTRSSHLQCCQKQNGKEIHTQKLHELKQQQNYSATWALNTAKS